MFKIARFSRLSQNIIQQIRQAILRGDLKPGDRLPPEKELSESFGVSKSSLREAFRALEALGLVEVRQGVSGGAFIKKVDLDTARENIVNYIFFQNPSIYEFTQLRSIIEPPISEIAARQITDEQLRELERNLIETKKDLDVGTFSYEIDISFHKKIASVANNSLISLIVDSMQNALVNIKRLLEPDIKFSLRVYEAHMRIYKALKERNPEAAHAEMQKHIKEVEEGLAAFCDPEINVFKMKN